MGVRIEGLDGLLVELDGLVDEGKMKKQVGKAGLVVERAAKQNAAAIKDTGRLADSIATEVDGLTCTVFTPLEYAPYVEYGTGLYAEKGGRKDVPWHYQDDEGNWHSTKGQHPRPFLRPAFDENREKVTRILEEGLGR